MFHLFRITETWGKIVKRREESSAPGRVWTHGPMSPKCSFYHWVTTTAVVLTVIIGLCANWTIMFDLFWTLVLWPRGFNENLFSQRSKEQLHGTGLVIAAKNRARPCKLIMLTILETRWFFGQASFGQNVASSKWRRNNWDSVTNDDQVWKRISFESTLDCPPVFACGESKRSPTSRSKTNGSSAQTRIRHKSNFSFNRKKTDRSKKCWLFSFKNFRAPLAKNVPATLPGIII